MIAALFAVSVSFAIFTHYIFRGLVSITAQPAMIFLSTFLAEMIIG